MCSDLVKFAEPYFHEKSIVNQLQESQVVRNSIDYFMEKKLMNCIFVLDCIVENGQMG